MEYTLQQSPRKRSSSPNSGVPGPYIEGNWTPTLLFTIQTGAPAYTTQFGKYVRIGSVVFMWFVLQLSSKGTVSAATGTAIQGFPYPIADDASNWPNHSFSIPVWENMTTAIVTMEGTVQGGTSHAVIGGATGAVSSIVGLTHSDFSDTTRIRGQFSYLTSA